MQKTTGMSDFIKPRFTCNTIISLNLFHDIHFIINFD